jgi:hypothetical protein
MLISELATEATERKKRSKARIVKRPRMICDWCYIFGCETGSRSAATLTVDERFPLHHIPVIYLSSVTPLFRSSRPTYFSPSISPGRFIIVDLRTCIMSITKADADIELHDSDSQKDVVGSAKKGTPDDQRDMHRMGKTQELRRNFRFVSIFGYSMILMATWETVLT